MKHHWTGRSLKWIERWLLCLLGLVLLGLWGGPAWGQLIDMGEILNQSPTVSSRRIGNLDVANVYLDSLPLFPIASPAATVDSSTVRPIDWRVKEIEFNLNDLLRDDFDVETLEVSAITLENQSVLQVTHRNIPAPRRILTITEQDIAISPLRGKTQLVVQRRAEILEQALNRAWTERQPGYLYRQFGYSILTLLGMGIATVACIKLDNFRRHRFLERLHHSPPQDGTIAIAPDSERSTDSVAAEGLASPQPSGMLELRSFNQARTRMLNRGLSFLFGVLLGAIQIGGIAWIASRFPHTRSFARWIISVPLGLLLIPVSMAAIKGITDWLVLLSLNRWIIWIEEWKTLDRRTKQRARTILLVFQNLTLYFVSILGILIFFQYINALPIALLILAIIGISSQSLIKDYLRGAWILIEDHYATGDLVQIETVKGIVEFFNLRVTQLRTLNGELVSIDNGSFNRASNLSKQWSQVNMGIDVAYDTDLERAIKIVNQVALDIHNDPVWKKWILEEPVILGVDAFGDNSITIRLTIKTQPGKQMDVGREYRLRLKPAFDRAGISIPFPQRSIWFKNSLDIPTSENYDL